MDDTPSTHKPSHFLREWREHHGLSLGQMAKATGFAKSTLSRIENDKRPYHKEIIEVYATVIGCTTGDLITHQPGDAAELWRVLDRCSQTERARALRLIKAILDNVDDL